MARYANILETIGRTPLVKINKLAPAGVNVFAKVESFNPMGSVKDRMARAVIEDAERRGELQPGQTVIEATSGNTGIGLAMVCAQKGYPLIIVMAESFSIERRKLLRFLGAKVVLTPAAEKGTGMLKKAEELAKQHGYYLCRQFDNEANADVHTLTTAQEIIEDFEGERLDYWVTGFGTGGTLKGVARALKPAFPGIRIVAAEPDNSPLLGSGIPQARMDDGTITESHPRFRPHLMQGWAPDFISSLTQSAADEALIDQIMPVGGQAALECARALATEEGILCGTSSGATLAAALEIARDAPKGANIVCMLPDTGERYLSTPLFEHISDDMTEEELAISRSTPCCRFDAPPPDPEPRAVETLPERKESVAVALDTDAESFVTAVIGDEPVVMFALEWCEFCWSVRKLFARLGIKYRSVDLDSVEYQDGDLGGRIRAVLAAGIGAKTIPQIFVAGQHIGGCTETFDSWRDGSLRQLMDAHGVEYDARVEIDPYDLLPKWLQPRKSA
ncbi:MAG: cysteine synthase A [Gammaproteobacteria bacterium]|jgi:cysteine synthase A